VGLVFLYAFYLIANGGMIAYVLSKYIADELYNTRSYIWVVCFFGAQIIGFFVYDLLALLLLSCCFAKKGRFVGKARWARDCFIISEDLRCCIEIGQKLR